MHIEDDRLSRLYDYWVERKGNRRFPTRRDLDPVAIRFILGHIILVDVLREPLRFRVRLHGTEMARQAQYELTGKFLDELPVAEYRDYVIGQCVGLVESGEPLHLHHNRILDNRLRSYEALWLPFSENGCEVTMLLCGLIYDAVPRVVPTPIEVTHAATPAPPAGVRAASHAGERIRAEEKSSRPGFFSGWPKAIWAR